MAPEAARGPAHQYISRTRMLLLQLPDQWEEVLTTVLRPGPITADSRCINTVPDDDNQVISLHPGSR